MLDAIFLCAGLAFFAAAIGYTLICEKLWWAATLSLRSLWHWASSATWFMPWSVRSGS